MSIFSGKPLNCQCHKYITVKIDTYVQIYKEMNEVIYLPTVRPVGLDWYSANIFAALSKSILF